MKAIGFLKPIAYPGLPFPAPVSETPVKLSETPGVIAKRAPTLGEHTDEVLASIGLTKKDIEAARAAGAV